MNNNLGLQGNQQSDCEAALELIPAYVLGAVDAEERSQVEAALLICPELTKLLTEYQAVSDMLAQDVPQIQPPRRAFDRLMASVNGGSRVAESPPIKIIYRRSRVLWAALTAALILLVASNMVWMAQVNELRQSEAELIQRVRTQSEMAEVLVGSNVQRVNLLPVNDSPDETYVTVTWNEDNRTAVLYGRDLPQLAEDQTYQLWLLVGEDRTSAGLFRPDDTGRGVLTFAVPAPLDTFTGMGITAEPAGGSVAPTSPPVAFGEV